MLAVPPVVSAVPADDPATSDAPVGEVRVLLDEAAGLDHDAPAWERIRGAAHRVTVALACDGRLAPSLVVAPGDPPVVVARTLAVVWRRLTAHVRCGETGRQRWVTTTTADG